MPSESYDEAYENEANDEALEDYDGESFEYDESYSEDDDDDEDFEDDDDDEDFESFEDDDDDEDFEDDDDDEDFEDDDDDEDFESFEDDDDDEDEDFEDDDDDEGSGEAIAAERSRRSRARARARIRARNRARARARARARNRARARQRAAARRARSNRSQLRRRFRGIRGARRTKARRLSRVKGSSIVVATLPNGRRTRMRISPAPASARSINRLRSQIAANAKRQSAAAAANAKAIKKLGAAQSAAVKKLTAQQLKADKALSKRIVAGDNKLDKRISKEFSKQRSMQMKHRRQMLAAMKRQRRRSLWNNILVTSAMPFFAAYGDRDNPFSRDNLILTGSLAGWLVGDELLDAAMARRGRKSRNMRTLGRGADLWSYLAPVGNAATVWWLLKDRQHERFISSVTNVTLRFNSDTGAHEASLPLASESSDYIAEKHRDDFRRFANVRAVATLRSPMDRQQGETTTQVTLPLTAVVEEGVLTFAVVDSDEAGAGANATFVADIAWVVDTKDPSE